MLQIVNRLVCSTFLAFVIGGCATSASKFDLSGESSETAFLVLPKPLRVLTIDGRRVNLPLRLEYPYTLTIPEGQRHLEFQYGEAWGLGRDNELVRGPIMDLEFAAKDGESYQIDFIRPESVENIELAEVYLESFSAWLADGGSLRVDAKSTGTVGGLGRRIASFSKDSTGVVAKSESELSVNNPERATRQRLQSLQQLWQAASDEEKKAFMQWVAVPGS